MLNHPRDPELCRGVGLVSVGADECRAPGSVAVRD